MKLLLLCDGERDELTIPPLLKKILNMNLETDSLKWSQIRLHQGSGYGRKLSFAFQRKGYTGIIALVDEDLDRKKERLKDLTTTREQERTHGKVQPAAIGMARPHGEAWLLDEPEAVKKVLQIPPETSIPSMKNTKNPKAEIERLFNEQEKNLDLDFKGALSAIAEEIDLKRYRHADQTGFTNFSQDVKKEFHRTATK